MQIITVKDIAAWKKSLESKNYAELLGQKLVTTGAQHALNFVLNHKPAETELKQSIEGIEMQLEIINEQLRKFN